ncbi:inhibitor of growth protein 3 [Lingula anatina]|uniref:Inhibitor of growth protein n=1 Tax=Lingula anatina TaxID=7574 RepID=A0A1S3IRD0_LINAN|nr:inhibitor of growth protein 3 [Lingula anatina]|eukprot:XP_013400628.1 inhibitor of growth protein 3 [Lingula anatina]
MLYLEDYLEMIENLPMEMRERFTDMRETDLEVQNAMDSLDDRTKTFFKKCQQPNVKQDWKDEQFDKIKQDYMKALEGADDKVQLANQIYDMVDRHLRKLDLELQKFKMELEADNAGITEILEKRSLELDNPPVHNNHKAEKRKYTMSNALASHLDKRQTTERVLSSLAHEAARETFKTNTSLYNTVGGGGLTLGQVGAQSNAAIAAAASQAIAATQQVFKMQQGRRTGSFKASYNVFSNPQVAKDFITAGAAIEAPLTPESGRSQRTKKQTQKAAAYLQQQQQKQSGAQPTPTQPLSAPATPQPSPAASLSTAATPAPPTTVEEMVTEPFLDENGQQGEWSYDPNEPRYCVCNQVSYGDMVGCDNQDCPIEWFHYGCVGLTQAPKGKWYCPQCTSAMKRRGRSTGEKQT